MSRSAVWASGVIALVGIGYLATIRTGHDWGDDFAQYISHARNLAEGRPYADTGYIYNPAFATMGPRTYPPVFPLLLAPVYRLFGLDLFALKVEMVLFFTGFLAVFYAVFRRELPAPYLIAMIALLALNPYLWDYKDRVVSEYPFLFFLYLVFFFFQQAQNDGRPWQRSCWALGAGGALYVACGVRSVGIVFVPCLLLDMWRQRRRSGWIGIWAVVVFAAGVVVQRLLLPFEGSYFDQMRFDPVQFGRNAVWLFTSVGLFVDNGRTAAGLVLSSVVVGGLGAVGYFSRLRQGATCRELFLAAYLAAMVIWPTTESTVRYLAPLAPLALVYVCHGLRCVGARLGLWWEYVPAAALALGILAISLIQYRNCDFGALREGIGKQESTALFDYVRWQTRPDAILLFQKPRVLALLTGRRAAANHIPADDADLWRYLHAIGATHVVVDHEVFTNRPNVLGPFVRRYPDRLRAVYANRDFTVYALLAPGQDERQAGRSPARK
jgi:4-amino-4-deoxy-L-arabinose transferase-like glycosyltransferase